MLDRISLLFAALSLANAATLKPPSPVALTSLGPVQGFAYQLEDGTNNTADIFLGIPYARPPIGELRFEVSDIPVREKESPGRVIWRKSNR